MKKEQKKKLLTVIKIISVVLLLMIIFRGVVVLGVFIALSFGISFLVNNFPIRNIGIELVTFIGILSAVRYGPLVGLIITFILITYHLIAGGFIAKYVLWVIPAYCIAAVVAGLFPNYNIVQLGIYLTIGINLNNTFFTGVLSTPFLPRYIPYGITNILFNVFMFTIFAKPISLFI